MSKKHNYRPAAPVVEKTEAVQPEVVETEAVVEPVVEPKVEEVAPVVKGAVTDCHKLNVRRAPSTNATVVCEIPRGAVVIIDKAKSKKDWYSVCTEAGVEGFCMKKYISIQ